MSTGTGLNVSKAVTYALVTRPAGLNASKAVTYALVTRPAGLNASKVVTYALITPINSNPPVWPSLTFPSGVTGSAYEYQFDLAPAASPVSYSVVSGALPPGLSLTSVASSTLGQVTGTPTAVGSYTFTLQATNAYGGTSKTFTLTVISAASINPVLVGGSLAGGVVDTPYSLTLTVSGGASPFSFAVIAGSLPTGLNLGAANGVISGTPTVVGTSSFTVDVTDSNGNTSSQVFALTIAAAPASNFCLIG